MNGLEYLGIAYLIIWLLCFAYIYRLFKLQKRNENDLKELKEKINNM